MVNDKASLLPEYTPLLIRLYPAVSGCIRCVMQRYASIHHCICWISGFITLSSVYLEGFFTGFMSQGRLCESKQNKLLFVIGK